MAQALKCQEQILLKLRSEWIPSTSLCFHAIQQSSPAVESLDASAIILLLGMQSAFRIFPRQKLVKVLLSWLIASPDNFGGNGLLQVKEFPQLHVCFRTCSRAACGLGVRKCSFVLMLLGSAQADYLVTEMSYHMREVHLPTINVHLVCIHQQEDVAGSFCNTSK